MKRLSGLIRYDKEFSDSLAVLNEQLSVKNPKPVIINGLSSGAASAYLAESITELRLGKRAPVLVLVSSDSERERVVSILSSMGVNVKGYKPRDFVFHNISASHDTERERLSVLSSVMRGECDAVVSTASAALSYTIPEELLLSLSVSVECGDEIPPSELINRLLMLGFVRVDAVESAGQFSARGGIVDLWHTADLNPVRIEFFGDEIDRMVYFDPITQRSLSPSGALEFTPAGESLVSPSARERIICEIGKLLKKCESDEIRAKLFSELSAAEAGLALEYRDKYFGLIYEKRASLLDYFKSFSRCAVFILETNNVMDEMKARLSAITEERAGLIELGLISEEAAEYTADEHALDAFLSENVTVHVNAFSSGLGSIRASGLFGFRCRRTVAYGENPSMLIEDITNFRKSMYRIVLLAENKQGADSIIKTLADSEIAAFAIYDKSDYDFDALTPGAVAVGVGSFEGYDLISPRIALLSLARDEGRRIMANRKRQRILRKAGGATERLMSYADLSVGDYVVHANYGIGLFEGMESVKIDGITKDYITIKYAGTDKLFVPCDRLEYIGKYIGEKDKDGKVRLSKMGGNDWTRVKSRAKSAAKDIAKDLIRLYAERQRRPGYAFPADTELDDEFAASFDFEETESQAQAIAEIKADMMRPVPMNRLLCGDVGFGKTEVALRAAFKAVVAGKQVAFLVPTTILALQHYQTALSRMRNYPITVEMLSRFRTPKEQEAILRRAKRGEIDVLIGTHKLFSKNLAFRDLGLLIIDEEQRFGVAQKEKLKELSKNIDVLTLTATPIPRTLNMAMNGISDMSILDEAPGDRLPVQTYVLEHDDGVIFDAMNKELLRGGQVLYLYNKVEDIEFAAGKIMRALPDARVAFAHGQMEKDELEDIWQMLVRCDIDILVCTTIIETGVDLPNANTLIIENADRMGLSQLHQIRGRVGRSSRQAYAYFTYRAGKALSDIASKRLKAIREYAEFGAGFKVALRDLEIRGAGNLLGAEQHGYIDSVGYDLYVKLLNEAVLEESGAKPKAVFESTVDIRIDAHIPESYISTGAHRMEMYKKISLIAEPPDREDVLDELIDRFGDVPKVTERLLSISLVRALASKAEIPRVEFKNGNLVFVLSEPSLGIWSELFGKHKGLAFRTVGSLSVSCRVRSADEALERALLILGDYSAILKESEKNNSLAVQ